MHSAVNENIANWVGVDSLVENKAEERKGAGM